MGGGDKVGTDDHVIVNIILECLMSRGAIQHRIPAGRARSVRRQQVARIERERNPGPIMNAFPGSLRSIRATALWFLDEMTAGLRFSSRAAG